MTTTAQSPSAALPRTMGRIPGDSILTGSEIARPEERSVHPVTVALTPRNG
ncbi:hypothetical protein ACFYZ5_34265 [Streptomyces chartreusis]|uniref:hypothetical protein n=1 Tax=Streptomyces chartreusis TaxID=1969 RepID=UPI00367B0C9D